jgi:hypothetical protein
VLRRLSPHDVDDAEYRQCQPSKLHGVNVHRDGGASQGPVRSKADELCSRRGERGTGSLHQRPITPVLAFPFARLSWALPPDVAPAFQQGAGWQASALRASVVADARPVSVAEPYAPELSRPV